MARSLRLESEEFGVIAKTHTEDALTSLSAAAGETHSVVSGYALPDRDSIESLDAGHADQPHLPFGLFTWMANEAVARNARRYRECREFPNQVDF